MSPEHFEPSSSRSAPARVHVVDDDPAMLDSLRFLIESIGFDVATFVSAEMFLDAIGPETAGCLVADLRLPGPMNGLDMHEKMLDQGRTLPTIIITAHGQVPHAVRAFKNGAIDFIQKPVSNNALLERIHAAMEQHARQRAKTREHEKIHTRFDRLTQRERQVMAHVVEGKTNHRIARALNLSPKTVEVHRAAVMAKTQAQCLPELVRMNMALDADPTDHRPDQRR